MIRRQSRKWSGGGAALLYCAALCCIFCAGCGSSGSANTGTTSTSSSSSNAEVATITVTPSSASIFVAGTQQFSATAQDSSGNALTDVVLTWASSASNVATIDASAGLATGLAAGTAQITASVNGVTSNAAPLTVSVQPQAQLNGEYAFLLQGFDDATANQFGIVGTFTADGNGNIVSGIEDTNGPNGYQQAVTFTGTYTVGSDNRGRLNITNSLSLSNTFVFALGAQNGGIATAGRIIEFDDGNGCASFTLACERGAGAIYLQDPTAFGLSSINGPYALQLFGQQATPGSWYVNTGAFVADGSGNLTSGALDTNTAGVGSQSGNFTATLAATPNTSSNGRLTYALASSAPTSGVAYIVSASRMLVMETDPEGTTGIEAGQVLAQSSTSFSNASLNGISVEYEEGLDSSKNAAATIGLLTFNGVTGVTFSRDYNDNGTTTTQAGNLTYATSANGRAVLQQGGAPFAILYLVDKNKGFLMSTGSSVTAGFLEPQATGPFSNASINGSYFLGTVPPSAASSNAISGVLASPGNGSASVTLDVSGASGLFSGESGSPALTVATNGRATDTAGDVYYIISATKLLLLPTLKTFTPFIDILQQ
jgi:hypothetical protein